MGAAVETGLGAPGEKVGLADVDVGPVFGVTVGITVCAGISKGGKTSVLFATYITPPAAMAAARIKMTSHKETKPRC
jgi:hypothetical protein